MGDPAVVPPRAGSAERMRVPTLPELDLLEIGDTSGLRIYLTRQGALFALRHGGIMINQVLPAPGETGLFRLLLRERTGERVGRVVKIAGPGLEFGQVDATAVQWRNATIDGIIVTTTLCVHTVDTAWTWRIRVENTAASPREFDLILAQDLGLAEEAAVRNNEAYTSQYIDLLPVEDAGLGWVVLARQGLATGAGRHPWLATACTGTAAAFATDGWQFYGPDHRFTGSPAAARLPSLPSRRLQYECAMAVLQTDTRVLQPGGRQSVAFVSCFEGDHPGASGAGDVDRLRDVLAGRRLDAGGEGPDHMASPAVPPEQPLFASAPVVHGETGSDLDWGVWFPGARRHEERDGRGVLLSFFHGADTHVVTRDKEVALPRPHGHILRSGEATWIDDRQFGVTCYAAGIFATQVYLGNPNFGRLVPVLRNAMNVMRGSGQRVFLRYAGAWHQLGIPSAFAMTPGDVRWIYRVGDDVIELRAWCSPQRPASFLEIRVTSGPPREFLISHELVLGATEYEHGGDVLLQHEGAWAACEPARGSLVGRHENGIAFAIAAATAADVSALGGDELLYTDGRRRSATYVVLATRPVVRCGVLLLGVRDGPAALPGAVTAARAEWSGHPRAAHPPALVLRLRRSGQPAVARVDDIVPWFNHNAAIHFSAPHGLEQYGGAAWGVRDVTQGSIEWLLTHRRHTIAARVIEAVFGQQYQATGTWPQWYMHPPYGFIQQVHSHGDVCFWPVKALCDFVEAANETEFMRRTVGYTDPVTFASVGPGKPLWEHCDRVIDHAESRFVAGTALVNYGDGDWDDTLQPADPAMRTRMVSAWTVALAYQTFCQLAEIARRAGEDARAARLQALTDRMARDFHTHLMPGGVVAGFVVSESQGLRPLLHPEDRVTGIRYRLLPMTRAIIAGLFTPEEARHHLAIIERDLRFPDGVRLMSDPVPYRGGREVWFKRADSAANVGREIGLQYVHAHIRYAEALARVGDAEGLWRALQLVNPVGLADVVSNASARQSNVYFSSSDPDFSDRYEAAARWAELKAGRVAVRGGWRLYSSGPGLFLHKLRTCFLGVRESFGDVIFDPVIPADLDGLEATILVCGRRVDLRYRVRTGAAGPVSIVVNGTPLPGERERNPYRTGGLCIPCADLVARLTTSDNLIEVER